MKAPWYADFVNYLASGILPPDLNFYHIKKFLANVKHFVWDEPLLYRRCIDGKCKRCIPKDEVDDILFLCHSSSYGGHCSTSKIAAKILQAGFYWPSSFKNTRRYVLACDHCQRFGNISWKREMPMNNILEIENFDVWKVDYIGQFPSSCGSCGLRFEMSWSITISRKWCQNGDQPFQKDYLSMIWYSTDSH